MTEESKLSNPTTHTYHLVYVTGGSTAHERELRVACLI
jgi:hypothetical protein